MFVYVFCARVCVCVCVCVGGWVCGCIVDGHDIFWIEKWQALSKLFS